MIALENITCNVDIWYTEGTVQQKKKVKQLLAQSNVHPGDLMQQIQPNTGTEYEARCAQRMNTGLVSHKEKTSMQPAAAVSHL
jgi:ABC-type dipeptide/oligopeptide/nickel transport system ATPase component